ncbi:hypothetical protein RF683_08550 [Flavobacterium sp. 20NA77.7]|uniref:Uncharacterized protein n=1 Tax=Flavobacterium nakdongensis TaxID=3073563 RepID=A0ABY9RBD8_9FLAO|nr:hypothetical protein [Flavobacterium sp. 20NA77.7]WMW77532.1 hypothetical protein RF683_08550 [Flavobacterium sp. 20NA77.7]
MIDYEQIVQKIINSITNFSFEFDFETVKKEMELQEIPKSELEKLGENKVQEKFNKGIFKIKMPNGNLIDSNSIYKYSIENNIEEPVIFINPNFKYVQWVVKKDFTTPQIKKQIKSQLTNNTDINLLEVQKALLTEDVKNKKIEGYVDELPIKTSNYISEGKFQIQSSCSRDSAIKMVNEVIEELAKEKKIYVKSKIRRDYKSILLYLILVSFITLLWFVNKQYQTLPIWLSNAIGIVLFLIPLVVMRLINHSIFDTLFFKKKSENKYEKEFNNKAI